MTKKREFYFNLLRSGLAILIALLVASLLIFISVSKGSFADRISATGEALKQMLAGPLFRFSKKKGTSFELKRLADILSTMVPIIFTGLSVCVMFTANQFNMGAEGGIMLGAFAASLAAIYLPLPAGIHPIVCVLIGGLVTALVMAIPAVLKAKLSVSEMVCSLMLNYIIMYIIKYVLNTYLADKSKGQVQSYPYLETAKIGSFSDNKIFTSAKLGWGFVIALIFVVVIGLFIYRSRWGYAIRMIGINQSFALYSGINVAGTVILSQVLGGFLAGVGGGIETLGRYGSYLWTALPGYGWTGITIGILAGNNPFMVPVAAFFMAYLTKGCDMMATYANVPAQLLDIIQGVIFLFFAAEQFLSGFRQKLVVKTAKEEIAAAKAAKAAAEGGSHA